MKPMFKKPLLKVVRSQPGRPHKFGRPAQAVTLTLPQDVIAALTTVNEDLSRAVVDISQHLVENAMPRPDAELARYGRSAVIVIKPVAALERIPGVGLIPLSDGRSLIAIDETMTILEFELKLKDLLEDEADMGLRERKELTEIADLLKAARTTKGISVHRRSIIVLKSTQRGQIAAVSPPGTTERRQMRKTKQRGPIKQ